MNKLSKEHFKIVLSKITNLFVKVGPSYFVIFIGKPLYPYQNIFTFEWSNFTLFSTKSWV